LYHVEKREIQGDARWGIMGFDAVYVRDELTPSIPGQTISIDPAELKDLRPSYRLLLYHLKNQGYVVDHNLAGEDRPETVQALNQELFSWAGLKVPE
jgi:hypothetical protein